MKLFFLPILVSCLLLLKLADARLVSLIVTDGYRVRYGDLGWEYVTFGTCSPDGRDGRLIDMAEIYQPTRCFIFSDNQCKDQNKSIVLHYAPGTYNTHVPKQGYKICEHDPSN